MVHEKYFHQICSINILIYHQTRGPLTASFLEVSKEGKLQNVPQHVYNPSNV